MNHSAKLLLLLITAACVANAQEYGLQSDLPINIDATSSDFNYSTNRLSFTNLRVTQGGLSIEADYAETDKLDFDDGLWVFEGNVRVEGENSIITGDDAKLTFKQHELSYAEINGLPAHFEQTDIETGTVNEGEGNVMVYDLKTGTITLTEQASFTDGTNTMRGSSITYDVVSQRIRADSGDSGSVRITIDPNSAEIKQYTE